ncbi:hypothetical protein QP337_28095, partial [Escherichia coli]|nr:hypothetical protein [Escherichia coli]
WTAIFSFSCMLLIVLPARHVALIGAAGVVLGCVVTFGMFGRRRSSAARGERIPEENAGDAPVSMIEQARETEPVQEAEEHQ